MPSQVRYIQRRNSAEWDALVRAAGRLLGQENDYYGITNEARADEVRKYIRTAGRHVGVGSRVYYVPCDQAGACRGGPECRYHVKYTIYPIDEARAFKARQAQTGAATRGKPR